MLDAPRGRTRDIARAGRSIVSEATPETSGRGAWLLLVGAALGLAIASFGLLEPKIDPSPLPEDAAAVVGERKIRRVDYERVLSGVAGDLRSPIDDAMRRRVLDRMIDEELLVQRALSLGLAGIDRRVRGELTSSMIDSIVSEVDSTEPDTDQIADHYEENVDFFTRPGRLQAQRIYFSPRRDEGDPRGPATKRAAAALLRLQAGDAPDTVEDDLADRQVSPVPNTMLPPSKVRDYVGPSLLAALMQLETGIWSEPTESNGSYHILRVLDREPPVVPTLEEIESLVRQDLKRRRGDDALRAYLESLKAETPIAIDERLFETTEAPRGEAASSS